MNAFEVFVTFAAVDHLTGSMRRIAREMGILDKQSEKLQKKLNGFKNMMWVGAGITGLGLAMGKGLLSAADAAGALELSMRTVQSALHMTNKEYERAQNLAQTAGIPTIFSAEEVGEIMRAMGTTGLSKKQVLDPKFLQQFVNFADVQSIAKHENAPDVVAQAVRMAHLSGIFDTKGTQVFLDNLNAALMHTHDSASEFATTFKYISSQSKAMKQTPLENLITTAWLGRMGFGSGRGGTNFAQFLTHSIYGSTGKKADAAMVEAGFVKNGRSVFTEEGGKFVGITKAAELLQDFGKRFHFDTNKMSPILHKIWGTQGTRIATMMGNEGAGSMRENVAKEMRETERVNVMQERFNKTWAGQTKQLKSVMLDIWQNFGKAALPNLMKVLMKLNHIVVKVLEFTQHNPKMMKTVAIWAQWATAAALIVGPLLIIRGAMGYLFASGSILAGVKMIFAAFRMFFGWQSIALVGLYEAWVYNWGGIRDYVGGIFKDFKDYYLNDTNYQGKRFKELSKEYVSFGDRWENVNSNLKISWDALCKTMSGAWHSVSEEILTDLDTMNTMMGGLTRAQLKAEQDAAALSKKYAEGGYAKRMEAARQEARKNPHVGILPYNQARAQLMNYNIQTEQEENAKRLRERNYARYSRGFASGTAFAPGGWSLVGERGPELVNLPRGASVMPNGKLGRMGATHIENLNVICAPGQSVEEVANAVMKKIAMTTRNKLYGSGDAALSSW